MDEAVAWVAQHLPFEVSAVLSYDEVRKILDWHLEYLRIRGVSSNGHGPQTGERVVVDPAKHGPTARGGAAGDARTTVE